MTGCAATLFVTWGLGDIGHVQDAYRLLSKDACLRRIFPVCLRDHGGLSFV